MNTLANSKAALPHVHRQGTTRSNGRAPATPVPPATHPQAPDRFLHEGLKAERARLYAARASHAPVCQVQICNASSRGRYTGAELQPYAGRPGSLDFLQFPSLRGGKRVYRRDAS